MATSARPGDNRSMSSAAERLHRTDPLAFRTVTSTAALPSASFPTPTTA